MATKDGYNNDIVTIYGSNGRPLNDGPTGTATVAQVGDSAASVTLKASNSARKGLSIFNDSSAALYVKMGATASTSSFTVKIAAGGYWEMPVGLGVYTGVVDGIWASDAGGNAYITEW